VACLIMLCSLAYGDNASAKILNYHHKNGLHGIHLANTSVTQMNTTDEAHAMERLMLTGTPQEQNRPKGKQVADGTEAKDNKGRKGKNHNNKGKENNKGMHGKEKKGEHKGKQQKGKGNNKGEESKRKGKEQQKGKGEKKMNETHAWIVPDAAVEPTNSADVEQRIHHTIDPDLSLNPLKNVEVSSRKGKQRKGKKRKGKEHNKGEPKDEHNGKGKGKKRKGKDEEKRKGKDKGKVAALLGLDTQQRGYGPGHGKGKRHQRGQGYAAHMGAQAETGGQSYVAHLGQQADAAHSGDQIDSPFEGVTRQDQFLSTQYEKSGFGSMWICFLFLWTLMLILWSAHKWCRPSAVTNVEVKLTNAEGSNEPCLSQGGDCFSIEEEQEEEYRRQYETTRKDVED